jgi:hypothetical protein
MNLIYGLVYIHITILRKLLYHRLLCKKTCRVNHGMSQLWDECYLKRILSTIMFKFLKDTKLVHINFTSNFQNKRTIFIPLFAFISKFKKIINLKLLSLNFCPPCQNFDLLYIVTCDLTLDLCHLNLKLIHIIYYFGRLNYFMKMIDNMPLKLIPLRPIYCEVLTY